MFSEWAQGADMAETTLSDVAKRMRRKGKGKGKGKVKGKVLVAGPDARSRAAAAAALADELDVRLVTVDLAEVVSRYIGETEKNIDRLFDRAARSGSALFFDEADALFGKRTRVRDAHDRYANLETGYLLLRIEAFEGLVILATNATTKLSAPFRRRMDHVVRIKRRAE